jgi:hypothetical protein
MTILCETFITANMRLFNVNNDDVIMCPVSDNQTNITDKPA